jgi:magnesium chelatase subunit D
VVLCRAAAAFAGWEGRSITTETDVERVAPLALGHRRRRRPFHPPALAPGELERALDATRHAFVAVGNGAGGLGAAPIPEPTSGDHQQVATAVTPGAGDPADAAGGEEPEATGEREPADVTAGEEPTDKPAGGETGPDAEHGKEAESQLAGTNATGADPRAVRAAAEAAKALVDLGGTPKEAGAGSEPADGVDEATAKPPPTTGTDEPAAHGS